MLGRPTTVEAIAQLEESCGILYVVVAVSLGLGTSEQGIADLEEKISILISEIANLQTKEQTWDHSLSPSGLYHL